MTGAEVVRREPEAFVPDLLILPIREVGALIGELVPLAEDGISAERKQRALIALVTLHDRLLGWCRRRMV